jgi:hypothetical protein
VLHVDVVGALGLGRVLVCGDTSHDGFGGGERASWFVRAEGGTGADEKSASSRWSKEGHGYVLQR